ncbi:RIP homotypic interaction motif-containing protein [Pseudomonas putida]|uniref:RIP homotypic interaction motif-containing protein n=1 Tax=Pseudomonas putida TaxID=303 RepID=UPI001404C843|nr:RIP homotypic interaction motif-containing protein [Pseudomonas putida]
MAGFMDDMENDLVYLQRENGERHGPYRCGFSTPVLHLACGELDVEDGDLVTRELPGGKVATYRVEAWEYFAPFGDLPASYQLTLVKPGNEQSHPSATTNHIVIQNSQGIQIGDNNVQQLTAAIEGLVAALNAMHAPEEEKREATSKLRELLENPLVQKVARIAVSTLF